FFALGVFLWLSLLNRMSISRSVLMVCFTAGCIMSIHGKGSCVIWLLDVIGAALIGLLLRFGVNRYVALIFAISFVMSATTAIAISVEPKLQKWLRSKIDHMSVSFALSH